LILIYILGSLTNKGWKGLGGVATLYRPPGNFFPLKLDFFLFSKKKSADLFEYIYRFGCQFFYKD
jgi:hypothetical protein